MTLLKKIFLIIIISASFVSKLSAQPGMTKDRSLYYDYGQDFYIETHFLPSEEPDSMKVLIFYRLANEMLIFNKNQDAFDIKRQFLAPYKVNVEFKDEDNIIRERLSREDTIFAESYEESRSKEIFRYGFFSSKLKAGSYKWYADVYDKDNKTLTDIKPEETRVYTWFSEETEGTPLFMKRSDYDKDIYNPFYLDGNLAFKTNNAFAFIPVSFRNQNKRFSYEIIYLEADNENRPWGEYKNASGMIKPVSGKTIKIEKAYEKKPPDVSFTDMKLSNNELRAGFLLIDMKAEELIPGKYKMKISETASDDSNVYTFQVLWEDMPLSLRNPEYALDMMYYILTEEEYDKLNEGDYADKFINILNYWKKKDPTPGTEYNEAMAEYFKRVDYAFFNFQTPSRQDGAKTERGKIYILYGNPEDTERILKSGKATEIWTYDNINKEFIFETQPAGDFKLKEIKDIDK